MKQIILENGKPPQFVGEWTIGEAMQMLQAALAWLGRLPLMTQPEQEKEEKQDGNTRLRGD